MSLAHNGVLFLDEFPEFTPQVLDSLRQPLETGEIVIARANHRVSYPSRFQLVAAMNPCRCGMAGEPGHTCRRGERCAADYQARISGPLMDRIDLRVEVPAVTAADLIRPNASETSADVAERVARARQVQRTVIRASACPSPPMPMRPTRSSNRSPRRTLPGRACCRKRLMRCGFPPAAITAFSRSPAHWLISMVRCASGASIWRKPFPTAWRVNGWPRPVKAL